MEDIQKMSKSSYPAMYENCDNNGCDNKPIYSVTHGLNLYFFCSHKCYLEKMEEITEKEKKQNGRNTERNSS